jgi:hypothetical protein
MITRWEYNNHGSFRDYVKNLIRENNYKTIDIGASARYWSYPECKVIVDAYPVEEKDITFFELNIENMNDWGPVFDYVEQNGKFDFSICSHTLEDVFNPMELISILQKISNRGYIAIPSKYDEFTKLFSNPYRGNAHHKQFFDVIEDSLMIFPKYNWIEVDERSELITKNYKGSEIVVFWENEIPVRIFGDGKPFIGDDNLINAYYEKLIS